MHYHHRLSNKSSGQRFKMHHSDVSVDYVHKARKMIMATLMAKVVKGDTDPFGSFLGSIWFVLRHLECDCG